MSAAETLDLEFEYANPGMMLEFREHAPLWTRDAAAYREASRGRAELDIAYGEEPRQRLDLFFPETPDSDGRGAVALFVHGGYFQACHKSSFSHLARGPNAHGLTVAIAGYTLCPQVTIGQIIAELQQAVALVARRCGRPVTVYGHSAGGHLAAAMLLTDWRAVDPMLDERTVPAALPISGLFALEPLVSTSLNERLGLDAAEARRLSPLLWPVPSGRSVCAYVGANESSEFRRQTRTFIARMEAAGAAASFVEAAGASHFSVITPLQEPDSAITHELVTLARGA